jgi:DNA (cytosine-5)-methyltransferase 1
MITFFDLFSGGGGAAQGAKQAGLTPVGGVEIDPVIASIYVANHGDHLTVGDVLDTKPGQFDRPDWFHASPVCKSFSAAKSNRQEHALDIACAEKVAEFIEAWQPQYFSLENVQAYAKSKSFGVIINALYSAGYFPWVGVLSAADFGVPQTRRRLIVLAVRGGFVPPLPPPTSWVGWYEAIADLLPGLPDSKLADWQYKAMPNEFYNFFIDADLHGIPVPPLLIENTGARSDRTLQVLTPNRPCWTLRAMGHDGHWHRANALEHGRIVQLDIACFARIQSFPDSYQWSGRNVTDGTAIGNSVCPLFFEKLITNTLS